MKGSGTAIMGSATAEGEDRARIAVREALTSPLLNDNKITGASDILLYISSGKEEITFDEVTEITDYIQNEAGQSAEVIWGNGFDEALGDKISITLIATGFTSPEDIEETTLNKEKKKTVYSLGDSLPNTTFTTEPINEKQEQAPNQPDSVSEIRLVKKDGKEPITRNGQKPILNTVLPPSLFDQPKTGTYQADTTKPPFEPVNDKSAITISNNNQSNLRIKHTVGSPDQNNNSDQDKHIMQKKTNERVKKLKEMSFFSNNRKTDADSLEKIPAYVRKNVELKPVSSSSESNVARFTLGEDEDRNPHIKPNDIPFIHNKPD